MTKDDIIKMAKEAGLVIDDNQSGSDDLERFYHLVAAHKCEALATEAEKNGNTILAMQIRARSQS